MSREAQIAAAVPTVLTLLGFGVMAGAGFVVNVWVFVFWGLALLAAVVSSVIIYRANLKNPQISTKLVIDSVDGQSVEAHLQVENTGSETVRSLLVGYNTHGFAGMELEQPAAMLPRTLHPGPPHRIRTIIPPGVIKRDSITNLRASVSCPIGVHGKKRKKRWKTTYDFLVRLSDLKPQSIDPDGLIEEQSDIGVETQKAVAQLVTGLAQPAGTLCLAIQERETTGDPTQFRVGEAGKYLGFDGSSKTVHFVIHRVDKPPQSLWQSLQTTESGWHVVAITWNSEHMTLSVDGSPVQELRFSN